MIGFSEHSISRQTCSLSSGGRDSRVGGTHTLSVSVCKLVAPQGYGDNSPWSGNSTKLFWSMTFV